MKNEESVSDGTIFATAHPEEKDSKFLTKDKDMKTYIRCFIRKQLGKAFNSHFSEVASEIA